MEDIVTNARRMRLRWFGHVERKKEDDWVRGCMNMVVEGNRDRGRPKKTWWDSVSNDMAEMGLRREDVLDRDRWRRGISDSDLGRTRLTLLCANTVVKLMMMM